VVGIAAIVAHREIAVLRHHVWKSRFAPARRRFPWERRFRWSGRITLDQFLSINPDSAVVQLDAIARKADHTFNKISSIRGVRRLEYDHLLAVRVAPKGHMPIREGHAGVVSDAALDEVIAH